MQGSLLLKEKVSRMKNAQFIFFCLCLSAGIWGIPAAMAASAQEIVAAQAGVFSTEVLSEAMAEYCGEEAPASAATVRQALQQWKDKYQTAAVRAQLEHQIPASKLKNIGLSTEKREQLFEQLANQGPAEKVCAALPAQWQSQSMNMMQNYPLAYNASSDESGDDDESSTPVDSAAQGTVYNVAQISHLSELTRGMNGTVKERLSKIGLAGRIYITGKVAKGKKDYQIVYDENGFKAKLAVVASNLNLAPYAGQMVTVSGTLDEVPRILLFLREARMVQNSGGLTMASTPTDKGIIRKELGAEDVKVAAGQGLKDNEIEAMFNAYVSAGPNFEERTYILLKDGTMYDRSTIAPDSLNVALSRKQEPQHWHKWKRSGKGISYSETKDNGEPKPEWVQQDGQFLRGWPKGQKLSGTYTNSTFSGDIALGGTYAKKSLTLDSNGRFEESNFSRSGSGSMAANMNDFSASATSQSDGSGTKSSAGGGTSNVYAGSNSARDDGADHRGQYSVNGYVMELRYDSGRVERKLSYPVKEGGKKSFFAGSGTYSVE